jgi:serine/threonine protein kinase
VGTLAYIAPEQTGRTGWPIDHRADLYAFGATLYEMLVGQPPFGDSDPLRVTRDHLTRTPVAPHATDPALPLPLSAITMRLLQKEPDQRYQSAEGLQYDLRVFTEGRKRGVPGPVVLGERDFPRRLSAPARLVGRAQETQRLIEQFDAAAAGPGRGHWSAANLGWARPRW